MFLKVIISEGMSPAACARFTRKPILVYRPIGEDWTISFEAEKNDYTTSQLKVVIKLMDDTLLGEAQTVDPNGKVSITLVIE